MLKYILWAFVTTFTLRSLVDILVSFQEWIVDIKAPCVIYTETVSYIALPFVYDFLPIFLIQFLHVVNFRELPQPRMRSCSNSQQTSSRASTDLNSSRLSKALPNRRDTIESLMVKSNNQNDSHDLNKLLGTQQSSVPLPDDPEFQAHTNIDSNDPKQRLTFLSEQEDSTSDHQQLRGERIVTSSELSSQQQQQHSPLICTLGMLRSDHIASR